MEGEPPQRLALVDDQRSVTLSPSVIEPLANDAVTVGLGGGALTGTLAVALALPPAPVQVTVTPNLPTRDGVYVFVPDLAVEPIEGEPLHAVVLVDDQRSVTLSPRAIELLSNDALAVGAGALTVTVSAA